jgi:hypothetical protein
LKGQCQAADSDSGVANLRPINGFKRRTVLCVYRDLIFCGVNEMPWFLLKAHTTLAVQGPHVAISTRSFCHNADAPEYASCWSITLNRTRR